MLLSHSSAGFAGQSAEGEELDAIVPALQFGLSFAFGAKLPVDVYPR
jgi:hypothetical protein